jgi:cytosine/adenosine deaminase-related metal-dependent hydrolase
MRFLTADYLFPLNQNPLKEGVLQVNDKGYVVAILKQRKLVSERKLEVYNGILCPGFVNSHCHLELSHLKELLILFQILNKETIILNNKLMLLSI